MRLQQAVQQQEENAAAVEEDNTGGGEELGDQGKENDSEEDEKSESEEEIVESVSKDEWLANHLQKESEDWRAAAAQRQLRLDEQDKQVVAQLDSQVAENSRRREQERQERQNTVVGLLVRDADPELGRQERRSVSQDQSQRILLNRRARRQQREDKVSQEREYLKQLSLEIDLHTAMELLLEILFP